MVTMWKARKEPWPKVIEFDAGEFWEAVDQQRNRDVVPIGRTPCNAEPDLFFSGEQRDIDRAKGLCAMCHVQSRCLSTALESGEELGVWGGLDADEREAILVRRARAEQRRRARKAAS